MEKRVVVRAIIYKDGKLLAVRHKKSVDHWSMPGGSLVDSEGVEFGLRRELMEELGVKAEIGRLLFVHQFYHYGWNNERLEFFFLIENVEDFVGVNLAGTTHGEDEIEEVKWINPAREKDLLPEFLQVTDWDKVVAKVQPVVVESSF